MGFSEPTRTKFDYFIKRDSMHRLCLTIAYSINLNEQQRINKFHEGERISKKNRCRLFLFCLTFVYRDSFEIHH